MINKNALLEIAKGSAATLVLFIAYLMLMFAGPLAGLFAPFPVLFYTLKSGRVVGLAIIVVATLALCAVSPAGALFYLFQCGLFALLLAEFLGRGNGAVKSIACTIAINLLVILVFTVFYGLWQGVDVNSLVLKGINDAVTQTQTIYQKSGIDGDDLNVLQLGLKQAADFVGKTYPSLLLVCLCTIAGFNILLLKKVAHRLSRQLYFGDVCRFKNPDKLVWVLIISGFALLLKDDLVTRAALNILIVTISLYFVQGLSVAAHFFKRFQVPRFMRLVFYVLLVVQPYLTVAVAAVGLFDLWCDFRTPKKQENL